MKQIYLDYASATPCDPDVVKAMIPYFSEHFFNPLARHSLGKEIANKLEEARQTIANTLSLPDHRVLFFSSGTEANHTVFNTHENAHLISIASEHKSTLSALRHHARQKHRVSILTPDRHGTLPLDELKDRLDGTPTLLSVSLVNSETGATQNITQLAKICHDNNALLHIDASQMHHLSDLSVVDYITINASKLYGPKGISAVLIGPNATPLATHSRGTPNVTGIIGLAKAVEILRASSPPHATIEHAHNTFAQIGTINSPIDSPIINITITGVDARQLVDKASEHGLIISTGSACTSGNLEPSHVLLAMGRSVSEANSSIRISLGRQTSIDDITTAATTLKKIISTMRTSTHDRVKFT